MGWNAIPSQCGPANLQKPLLISYGKERERHPDATALCSQVERYPDVHSFVHAACFSRRVLSSIRAPAIISKRSSSESASVKATLNLFIGLL